MSVSDEVKQRVDIVEFISRYTPLKRTGSTYKGLCPFHSERTPSFIVFPHTGTWRCFGACGIGGDIFSFVMRKENLDFRETLQMLAREVGVNLQEESQDASASQRTQIYEVNELAAKYYFEQLQHHPAAQKARDYLQRRGIDQATCERFGLGFALDSWSSLRDYLLEKGFNLDLLQQAGLIKRNDERNSTFDAFRSRLMIPIRDRQGRTIGFGGRVLDDSQPKYLNTSETPLFHKSRVIYGLDLAQTAIREAKKVVIVEGYMDVIAAHQHGFANVVACMGTALTTEQLQQLQRFTNDFVLALDADAAGQQATIRGLNQARQALGRIRKPTLTAAGGVRLEERLGANLFIAAMPEGLDPDDVVRQNPALWQKLINQALPFVDFYFDIVAAQYDVTTAQGKGTAVTELTPLIAELQDEVEQKHYIDRLSRWVHVDERTLWDRVQAVSKTGQIAVEQQHRRRPMVRFGSPRSANEPGEARPQPDPVGARPAPRTALPSPTFDYEDHLVANLLREPDLVVWLAGAADKLEILPLQVADLQNVENQEIFRALKQFVSSDEQWDIELFQEALTPHLHGRLAQLLAYGAQMPVKADNELREDIVRTLLRIRLQRLSAESANLKFLEADAFNQGDVEGSKQWGDVHNRHLRDFDHLQKSQKRISQLLFRRRLPEQGMHIKY